MNTFKKIFSFLFTICVFTQINTFAQSGQSIKEKEADYLKVVTKRAGKIVETLNIPDSVKFYKVREIIAYQYRDLNKIHDRAKESANNDKDSKLKSLHNEYLSKLAKELNPQQIEKVKDGMTYKVLPITYKGYQEMLPDLTSDQKKQILQYLTEARELAMDAGSSEEKHAWFGKYKGKINNYLSAAGIDMKQASKDWATRVKAANKAE